MVRDAYLKAFPGRLDQDADQIEVVEVSDHQVN